MEVKVKSLKRHRLFFHWQALKRAVPVGVHLSFPRVGIALSVSTTFNGESK